MDNLDIDPNFEPQTRARSNTWPLPRPDTFIDQDTDDKLGVPATIQEHGPGETQGFTPKKNSSRRNAWGNMSYADLISQAINATPDKRLTLAQIYEWMVQNIQHFKDKGDSNSSAGWKNSIRHNLSLHNRFMRVQNEGTGKSSWWMINPDAKPGKAARRRATSMETPKYEKKRGRVKKKVEALRNGLDTTPSPSSSVSEALNRFPDSPALGFQLSPEFRPRASSNASSCSRLSPISVLDSERTLPPLSPIPWNIELASAESLGSLYGGQTENGLDVYGTDQLVDTLADSMKLGSTDSGYLGECSLKSSPVSQLSPSIGNPNTNSFSLASYGATFNATANSEYVPFQSPVTKPSLIPSLQQQQARCTQQVVDTRMNEGNAYTITNLQTMSPSHNSHPISPSRALNSLPQTSAYTAPLPNSQEASLQGSYCISLNDDSMVRLLNSKSLDPEQCHNMSEPLLQPSNNSAASTSNSSNSTSLSSTANQVMGHLLSLNNPLPNDLDLNFDLLQGGLECDVDQVISHELSVDGNLDFNFDPSNASSSQTQHSATMAVTTAGGPWVH